MFKLAYCVRSYDPDHVPLLELDAQTNNAIAAARDASARADEYGTWDDVAVIPQEQRAITGIDLERWCHHVLFGVATRC